MIDHRVQGRVQRHRARLNNGWPAGLLRQQLPTNCQVHGITTHGGEAPNVIPGRTEAQYYLRSTSLSSLEEVRPKIDAALRLAHWPPGLSCALQNCHRRIRNLLPT
ncbi:MAG: peptidase dimerization domain-containing protein [Ferrimicrobium sp.]